MVASNLLLRGAMIQSDVMAKIMRFLGGERERERERASEHKNDQFWLP